MTNRFMISVATLALVAGTGFANAQGTGTKDYGSGQQTQQNAQPSQGAAEHGGAMGKEREKGTVGQAGGSMKSGAEEKSGSMKNEQPGAMHKNTTAKEGEKEKGTVGQAGKSGAEEKSSGTMKNEKSSGTMNKNPTAEEKSGATKGERAQGQQDKSKGMSSESQTKSGTSTTGQNREGQPGTNVQGAQGQTGTSTSTQTVGQAGAGAKLSTEQRTQITSVIREEHVRPVTNVNFSISVGTRIPREGIELHALPSRVVTIYPEWRTYKYIIVKEEIVIINPDTYEIVAVLNV